MIEATCHCGAVRIEAPAPPTQLTDCNCSICRRIGGLWAYYPADQVRISAGPDATLTYIWGDKMLALHTCKTCGCTTHWLSLGDNPERMGINARMFEPREIAAAKVRRFDGAETWTFLDEG